MEEPKTDEISKEEFSQYDRQIRLWGLNAQKLLRQARVLVVNIGGLGSEVVKNIVLAGIHSITLMDHRDVTREHLTSQLLITPERLGHNLALASRDRTQELNPNVEVKCSRENIMHNLETVKDFDVVCLTEADEVVKVAVNTVCRKYNVKFFCGSVFGFYASAFLDLGRHEYMNEDKNKEEVATPAETKEKKQDDEVMCTDEDDIICEGNSADIKEDGEELHVEEFCSYDIAVKEDWSKRSRREMRQSSQAFFVMRTCELFTTEKGRKPQHDRADYDRLTAIKNQLLEECGVRSNFVSENFHRFCISTLSAVAAITGGVIAQEMIKALTKKGKPHDNFFFFDGLKKLGIVDRLGSSQ